MAVLQIVPRTIKLSREYLTKVPVSCFTAGMTRIASYDEPLIHSKVDMVALVTLRVKTYKTRSTCTAKGCHSAQMDNLNRCLIICLMENCG